MAGGGGGLRPCSRGDDRGCAAQAQGVLRVREAAGLVGRAVQVAVSKPELKARLISAPETEM